MTRSITTVSPTIDREAFRDESLPRSLGILCLLAIALIHLLDFKSKWHEVKYLSIGYLVLIAVCLVVADRLFHKPTPTVWIASGLVGFSALIAFVVNRTIGLPQAHDDIGNWAEPLGIATLFAEVIAVYISINAVRHRH